MILSVVQEATDDGPYAGHPRQGDSSLAAREEIFVALAGGRVIAAIKALRQGKPGLGCTRRKL